MRLEKVIRDKKKTEEKRIVKSFIKDMSKKSGEAREAAQAEKNAEYEIKFKAFEDTFVEGPNYPINKVTNLKYDENFFCANRLHVVTKKNVDIRGFNCIGICKNNDDLEYDKNGFKFDGRHYLTNEYYYEGFNCYGVDENGLLKNGKEPSRVKWARSFFDLILGNASESESKRFIFEYVVAHSKRLGFVNLKVLDLCNINQLNIYAQKMLPVIKEDIFVVSQINEKYNELINEYSQKIVKQIAFREKLISVQKSKNPNSDTTQFQSKVDEYNAYLQALDINYEKDDNANEK